MSFEMKNQDIEYCRSGLKSRNVLAVKLVILKKRQFLDIIPNHVIMSHAYQYYLKLQLGIIAFQL